MSTADGKLQRRKAQRIDNRTNCNLKSSENENPNVPTDLLPTGQTATRKAQRMDTLNVPTDLLPTGQTAARKAQRMDNPNVPTDLLPTGQTATRKAQRMDNLNVNTWLLLTANCNREKLREWTTWCWRHRLQSKNVQCVLSPTAHRSRQAAKDKSSENGPISMCPPANSWWHWDCNREKLRDWTNFSVLTGQLQVRRMDQPRCTHWPTLSSKNGPTSVCPQAYFNFREWTNLNVLFGLL